MLSSSYKDFECSQLRRPAALAQLRQPAAISLPRRREGKAAARGIYKIFSGMETSETMEDVNDGNLVNQTPNESQAQTEETVNKKKKATTSDV
ncbi:hypothetical protein PIB30_064799 [Stylosanthes scabra]|uniref:Uncharacterized protein n=1 Tax=Stylosanthes scabra TaxID=79078 RepID=A0ABU6ZKI4_9FABA|nr:hypothetical protein [Stylosanthes scabra]